MSGFDAVVTVRELLAVFVGSFTGLILVIGYITRVRRDINRQITSVWGEIASVDSFLEDGSLRLKSLESVSLNHASRLNHLEDEFSEACSEVTRRIAAAVGNAASEVSKLKTKQSEMQGEIYALGCTVGASEVAEYFDPSDIELDDFELVMEDGSEIPPADAIRLDDSGDVRLLTPTAESEAFKVNGAPLTIEDVRAEAETLVRSLKDIIGMELDILESAGLRCESAATVGDYDRATGEFARCRDSFYRLRTLTLTR